VEENGAIDQWLIDEAWVVRTTEGIDRVGISW